MPSDPQTDSAANAAAEEILRMVYGDDLRGRAVSVEQLAAVIHAVVEQEASSICEVTKLHLKGFEAVQLLSTPPQDGPALSAEDLRSLLGDRLDRIRTLATNILATTQVGAVPVGRNGSNERPC